MGDPMWRLATSINYVSEKIFELGREQEVEVVVADWGSKVPIASVVELTERAAAITSFIHVSPALAGQLQQDSPFAEVYALNVAARRSKGEYIGRIDQDTLVTEDFFKSFFDAVEGKTDPGFEIEKTYMFAARKQLPYSYVKQKPDIHLIDKCIKRYRSWIFSEELKFCHWASPVGILMMHRDMWDDIGGYDERLIHYWFTDVDLATRLLKKYNIVNIGKAFGYHFFHLEHMTPGFRFRHSHRKLNPEWSKSFDKPVLNPNGPDWGMNQYNLVRAPLSNEPVISEDITKQKNGSFQVDLLLGILAGSLKRWTWYQLKYGWYLAKKVRKKPYL